MAACPSSGIKHKHEENRLLALIHQGLAAIVFKRMNFGFTFFSE